jgi:pimeloyl-ACP methyl ester carboxylesterase
MSDAQDPLPTTVTVSDHQVATERGTLFARAWHPAERDSDDTILLFHDSLGCVALWRDFPERLAAATRRAVVAYDRLGFGRSDPHRGRLPLTFVEDEATTSVPRLREALRDVVPLERLVAFGHSVGGGMAVATAAWLGEACTALVTVAAQSFVEDHTIEGILAARAAFEQPGQIERLARYHGEKARWVLDAWIDSWLHPDFAGWNLDDQLRRVHCPTLALHGDRDEFGSTEHPHRIARLVQGPSRAVVLAGVGHVPHREEQSLVLDEVVRFLHSSTPR